MWHLPAYYELRQDPRAYSIFAQILKDPKLTVSLDRVSFKTPAWVEVEKDGKVEVSSFRSVRKWSKVLISEILRNWTFRNTNAV